MGLPKHAHCGPIEFNHVTVAGFCVGERYGYALGRWHHQGFTGRGYSREKMWEAYGPNLRDNRGDFHARFGTDQALQNSQDDRIGYERFEIIQRRERDPFKSKTSRPAKMLPLHTGDEP